MTRRQDQIAEIIRKRGSISCGELAKALGCTPRAAGQQLWLMGRVGMIEPSGVGRFTRWTLPATLEQHDPVGARVRWIFDWRPV